MCCAIGTDWKSSYSCSTNHKVWAAKFTARHPNLVALEVSGFKPGLDAPIYGVIEGIIEQSGTPYFCFKDLDENKPSGLIRIRVETIDRSLRRHRDEVIRKRKAAGHVEAQQAALEPELRGSASSAAPQLRQEIQALAEGWASLRCVHNVADKWQDISTSLRAAAIKGFVCTKFTLVKGLLMHSRLES